MKRFTTFALAGVCSFLALQATAQPSLYGSWTPPVETGVVKPSNAMLLKNHLALVCGSVSCDRCLYFDYTTDSWFWPAAPVFVTPQCPGQAALEDGTLLWSGTNSECPPRTDFFDPSTGQEDHHHCRWQAHHLPQYGKGRG